MNESGKNVWIGFLFMAIIGLVIYIDVVERNHQTSNTKCPDVTVSSADIGNPAEVENIDPKAPLFAGVCNKANHFECGRGLSCVEGKCVEADSGSVTISIGVPNVLGSEIVLIPESRGATFSAKIERDSKARFNDMPAGEYEVLASAYVYDPIHSAKSGSSITLRSIIDIDQVKTSDVVLTIADALTYDLAAKMLHGQKNDKKMAATEARKEAKDKLLQALKFDDSSAQFCIVTRAAANEADKEGAPFTTVLQVLIDSISYELGNGNTLSPATLSRLHLEETASPANLAKCKANIDKFVRDEYGVASK